MTAASPDPALEAALETLFAAPFPEFVEERKRLVVGLRAAGHKAAATALGKVNRPTLASWAINQLVRRAPAEVSTMFATAARVRLGDFAASAEHRQVIARLSALATEILREHDQPTSEATLRRITTSLQALSAYGDFAPDLPGRMIGDRDPPGFDAMALESSAASALPLSLPTPMPTPTPHGTPHGAPAAATAKPAAPVAAPAPAVAPAPAAPVAPVRETAATIKARIAAKFAEREASASSSTLLAQLAASAALPPADEPAATRAAAPPATPHLRIVPRPAEPAGPAETADEAADTSAADAEAQAAAEAAERAVAEAAAALAAAQAAAKAAAARVHLARQKAVLEDLRTRQRRAASSIYDHEQAIALMQRELEQRQAQLATARRDADSLLAEIERLSGELAALEKPAP